MPELLHPGVYVQEVPSMIKSIEGVSTSTAAFIGSAERGPIGEATLITSFNEYRNRFGGFIQTSLLTYSVLSFFENGGRKCYIVRTIGEGAEQSSITLCDRERLEKSDEILFDLVPSIIAEPILVIKAANPGAWGNKLDILIKDDLQDKANLFKIIVQYDDEEVETWTNLSMVQGEANYIENILGPGQSQYIEVERKHSETTASPGLILSGQDPMEDMKDLTDVDALVEPVLTISMGPVNGESEIQITCDKNANSGEAIANDIQEKVRSKKDEAVYATIKDAIEGFRCCFTDGRYCLISGEEGLDSSINVIATTVNDPQRDIRDDLKLNTEADGDAKALKRVGEGLQCGSSKSDNEPATIISTGKKLSFNLNGDGIKTIELDAPLNSGDGIADNIQVKIRALAPARNEPINQEAYNKFEARYEAYYEVVFGEVPSGEIGFKFNDMAEDVFDLKGTEYFRFLDRDVDLKEGYLTSQRTLISESVEGQRPISSLKGISNPDNKALKLAIAYKTDSIDWTTLSILNFLPEEELITGEQISSNIEVKLRSIATDQTVISGLDPAIKELMVATLSEVKVNYVAYYMLSSKEVRTQDAANNIIGPISSIKVLPADNLDEDVSEMLKLGLHNNGTEQNGASMLRPPEDEYHLGDNSKGGPVADVQLGGDGLTLSDSNYTGDNGIKALDTINDVSMIAIPGMGSKAIVSAGLSYCANRSLHDCFFIGDVGSGGQGSPGFDRVNNPLIDTRDEAIKFVKSLPVKNSYGSIYFPWIESYDPIGLGKNPKRLLPPSGYIAGLYSKTDNARGVWKAPAGTEVKVSGTSLPPLRLACKITDTDQDFLNPRAVNVIRAFAASGTVVWGARTLSSDSSWRYVPVRRMAIFLRVSIYNGIQWAVFEPNDEGLWASLRLNVGSFMMRLFREGAFQGSSASDAFFVSCDSSTTTQDDIDAGVVNVLVGFAPLKPAEFVVVKISQKAGNQNV